MQEVEKHKVRIKKKHLDMKDFEKEKS